MEEYLKLLSEVNVISIFVRMVLAMILCGAIGIERGIKNRPAGFMTYLLVGCGSTLIMITNQYIAEKYPGVDPTRMAAQVVSGIGFLGAGTIITTSKQEGRGLTTAAGLWAAAAVGLAIGIGFYSGAIIGAVLVMLSLLWLKKIDAYVKTHARVIEIYLEYNREFSMEQLLDFFKEQQYELFDLEIGKTKTLEGELGNLNFMLDLKQKVDHGVLLSQIEKIPGITNVRAVS